MKNKNLIIIILSVIVVILAGVSVWLLFFKGGNNSGEEPATGSFYNSKVTTKGYTIDINSTEPGHPEGDSIFSTSLEIDNNDGTKYAYGVAYKGIELYDNGVPTVLHEGYVTINNKKFGYYLDDNSADLYYALPSNAGVLVIEVRGAACFDENGNTAKCLAPVTEKTLKSKELAGVINFEVTKEQ